jgi:hypothetical protein
LGIPQQLINNFEDGPLLLSESTVGSEQITDGNGHGFMGEEYYDN